jgi:hypothetical protein
MKHSNFAEKKLYAWIQYVFHVAIYDIKNSCRKDRTSGRKSLNQSLNFLITFAVIVNHDFINLKIYHTITTTLLNFVVILVFMGQSTGLENSTYNILRALGKEADFLYSTVDTYIEDAKKDNRQNLVEIWNQMKRDKEKHLQMLREALEEEAKEEKLSK